MKKSFILILLMTLFLCPMFSQEEDDDDEDPYKDRYYIGALTLDVGIPINRPVSLPVKPGIYFAYNSFDEDRTIGFHFDANLLSFYGEESGNIVLASSSIIGPAFRFKNKNRFLLSAGLLCGLEFYAGDEEGLFDIYAGLGATGTVVFKSDICVGLTLGYSPLCFAHSYSSSDGSEDRLGQFIRVGIFVGFCMR